MVKGVIDFIKYWYFRYLLVTELYMVEEWERVMFHTVLFILVTTLSIFNTSVVLTIVTWMTRSFFQLEGTEEEMNLNQPIHGEL